MALRCKPGDLAVIVNAGTTCQHLIGRIVRVRKAHSLPWLARGPWGWTYYGARLKNRTGSVITYLNDCALRPLRDDPGQDETLRLAGLPAPQATPVEGVPA